MINIADIHDCFGCGVCAKACPKQIIALKLNKNGFYEPRIESADQCIKCSICVEVCAFAADSQVIDLKPTSYAAWSLNDDIRKNSSSGGIAFEIGRQMLQQGFKICVVRYNYAKQIPEHYIARNEEELAASAGSKYLQSDTTDGFAGIDIHDKYVVTGTPCQIASFRRYIRRFRVESNFILVDFFCQGVPSMLLWQKYLRTIGENAKLTDIKWRSKRRGWHDSWAMDYTYSASDGIAKGFSALSDGDLFYKIFLKDMCLGSACYKQCKYKLDNSAADLRVGDLWGSRYQDNEQGVSALIPFTERGQNIVEILQGCHISEISFETAAEGQMRENARQPGNYDHIMSLLRNPKISLRQIERYVTRREQLTRIVNHARHPTATMRKLIKRIAK